MERENGGIVMEKNNREREWRERYVSYSWQMCYSFSKKINLQCIWKIQSENERNSREREWKVSEIREGERQRERKRDREGEKGVYNKKEKRKKDKEREREGQKEVKTQRQRKRKKERKKEREIVCLICKFDERSPCQGFVHPTIFTLPTALQLLG